VSSIQESLADLQRAEGIKGCALVTNDGLIVAEALDEKFRGDVIAGLASYLTMTTNKVLTEGGEGGFDRFTIHAAHGKAVFEQLEESVLVVLLDQFADLEGAQPEIRNVAQRLRRQSRI
jgi:predicted regulator of Ras-like GTPase activity (Roadblock/LC7/MglB family)